MTGKPFRVLPCITPENRHFWTGGADGELRFMRCGDCRYWIHPPAPICPECLSKEIEIEAASGRGVIHTYTINRKEWYPNLHPPYPIAIVSLDEQEDLRLTTNIVDCAVDEVEIGMPVEVVFEEYDEVYLPMFRPRRGS
ncbi:MAG: hypothetical protein JJLCMIEE_00745 [Acidimicrobiales bacterium]|nr:hypothetical protein [Acidimicrobiales bacterium]